MRAGCVLLCALCALGCVSALVEIPLRARGGIAYKQFRDREGPEQKSGSVAYFDQRYDHFTADTRTFKQKYYVDKSAFSSTSGPVFLYICGEAPCTGQAGGYVTQIARYYKALVLTLEHRFYGESVPGKDWSTANLAYLTVEQALADLADFRDWYQSTQLQQNNKWIIVGGSYAGAMSSWFKIQYPDKVVGAWSSSGVVNAIFDFPEFDEQIALSAGDSCADVLRRITDTLDSDMQAGVDVKALFGAQVLSNNDFWFMVADSMSMAIQYGSKSYICSQMTDAYSKGENLSKAFADFTNAFWGPNFGHDCYYDSKCSADPAVVTSSQNIGRCWHWQTCLQLAYLQSAPKNQLRIRHTNVTIEYLLQQCIDIFGPMDPPATDEINNVFGGAIPKGHNTVFVDASDDPWQRASVDHTIASDMPYYYVECDNCGHCIDLGGSSTSDPTSLKAARDGINQTLFKWLN